jgi:hypothetical protein
MGLFAIGSNYKTIKEPTWIPYLQAKHKELGRPRGTQMRGDMDTAKTVPDLRWCRICNEIEHDAGHARSRCRPIVS